MSQSSKSSSRVSVVDAWNHLNSSVESINLDHEEELNERLEELDMDNMEDEEPMDADDDLRDVETSSSLGHQNAGDEAVNVDELLPKSTFVFKYPSNGGGSEPDFSLIWLVGSLLHSQSHNAPQSKLTTIFNKYQKLKEAALKADLRDICENLDKHIPELLDTTAIQGVGNQRVNSFNRVHKIGVLMEGLVAVLNQQLRFCKNEAQTFYINFQRRNVQDKTLNMNKPGISPKQINISNLLGNDYNFPGPGRFDMSFFNMNMDTDMQGEGRCASPRKAGGGEFFLQTEPGILDSSQAGATSISTTSNERLEKAKKQRKQKRKFADDIIRKLEQHSINLRENQLIDFPADDGFGAMHNENFFDPTSLPPPSIEQMEELSGEAGLEAEEAVRVDQSCYQDQEISPKRKKVDDGVLRPPPAPTKRNINGLEPLHTSPDSTKSPRQRRKQQCLRFDDQVNIISKREMMTNVNRKPLTDEEKQELLDSLFVQKVFLEGQPLIQRFGRNISSSRLSHMVAAIWSNGNVVRTESNDSQLALPLLETDIEGLRQTGLSDPTNSTVKTQKSNERARDEFPPTVDDENPLDNLLPHPGPDPIPGIMEPKARQTFEDILGDKPSRLDAARTFTMLLNLQAKRKFMLSQEEPYGQITIEKIHDRA